jgi:hypothetical protein
MSLLAHFDVCRDAPILPQLETSVGNGLGIESESDHK